MPRLRQLLHPKALTALLFTVAVLFFSPTIVVVCWHLKHGGFVVYRDKRIPVPSRWIVDENVPQGLELVRLPITVLGLRLLPASASLSKSGPSKVPIEERYQSFQ